MEHWRRLICHDGYSIVDLRMSNRRRAVAAALCRGGYNAQCWLAAEGGGSYLDAGPIEVMDERRGINPGETWRVALHPTDPSRWCAAGVSNVRHLQRRAGQILGVATVKYRG